MKPMGITTNGMAIQVVPNSQNGLEHGFEAMAMPEFVNGVLQCIEFLERNMMSLSRVGPFITSFSVALTGNSS